MVRLDVEGKDFLEALRREICGKAGADVKTDREEICFNLLSDIQQLLAENDLDKDQLILYIDNAKRMLQGKITSDKVTGLLKDNKGQVFGNTR